MNNKNYHTKSYKEKEVSTPYESGRKELSTKGDKDNISTARAEHNTNDESIEYTHRTEVEGAFGDSAYNAEQKIYDTIDYDLGSENIAPELLEALKFYEEHEEIDQEEYDKNATHNKTEDNNLEKQYKDYDEDFYKQRRNEKLSKKELKKQKLEEKYSNIEEEYSNKPERKNQKNKEGEDDYYGGRKQAKVWKNTKSRNAKSKEKHNRSHKTDRKNRNNTQKDIEKYGLAA